MNKITVGNKTNVFISCMNCGQNISLYFPYENEETLYEPGDCPHCGTTYWWEEEINPLAMPIFEENAWKDRVVRAIKDRSRSR